jgi:S1-C subfamily serine protease
MCGVLFTMLLRNLPRQGVSSIQVEKNLPKLLPAKKYDWNRSVVRLYNDEGFFCSGVVIGANYVLTAAHCLVDENGVMKRQRVIVENDDGTIRLTSKPVGVNLRMDWGLLESDFSDIPAAEVWESGFEPQAQVLACGYPQGSKTLNCQVLVPVMNDAFLVKCAVGGMLFPGMSGGPVFDKAGHVLGLNTAMYPAEEDGGTAYSPTIGILANFHIAD